MAWADYNRIDPGPQNGSTPAWGEMYPRRQNTLGEERGYSDWGADAQDTLSALASLIAPNLMEGRRAPLESAMLDVGNWAQFPEAGAMKAGAAALPAAAGMVRLGGKDFKNAFLHRAIGDAAEVPWWRRLLEGGFSTEKPTTFVDSNSFNPWRKQSTGLLFNVPDESTIKHFSLRDLGSEPTRHKLPGYDIDDLWRESWTPGKGGPDPSWVTNEVIAELNPKNLAGITLPDDNTLPDLNVSNWLRDRFRDEKYNPLIEALKQLGQDLGLPTFRWRQH